MPRLILILLLIWSSCSSPTEKSFNKEDVINSQRVIGLDFSSEEIDSFSHYLEKNKSIYEEIREYEIGNEMIPSFLFDPQINFELLVSTIDQCIYPASFAHLPNVDTDIAYLSVFDQAALIRKGELTSVQLTQIYIDRILKYDDSLKAVIYLMKNEALEYAQQMDEEISEGKYRGPLHGIPYGVKDLAAVVDTKTTWGAEPYKDQAIDKNAHIVTLLRDAGAVLLAKLTTGALASGDRWYGGQTKNPWDLGQGASGSSAGPASATSAGLVSFSIGTETWGSIISPSLRCGVTGLRPSYGTVSRDGIMTLSWTLDKVGPIARSAMDCALVYDIIEEKDEKDPNTFDSPFFYQFDQDLSQLKIGYLEDRFEKDTTISGENARKTLAVFRELGANLIPAQMPQTYDYENLIHLIIRAEAGAVFDDLVTSNREDLLKDQGKNSRANSLRMSRFIPAVEYIQAQRLRSSLIKEMQNLFQNFDAIIVPSRGEDISAIGNLSGYPIVSFPNGFDIKGRPTGICILGNLTKEGIILSIASQYQEISSYSHERPPKFSDSENLF